MTKRRDKVEAAVYPIIHNVSSIQSAFIPKESFELIVNVLNNRSKTICVVNRISVSRSIDNSQSEFHSPLLNLNRRRIQLNSLISFFCKQNLKKRKTLGKYSLILSARYFLTDSVRNNSLGIQIGEKKAVDQGRFSEA